MPLGPRFRRNDDEGLHQSLPESTNCGPEEFVERIEPWPRMPTIQNSELLPEREILQDKVPTVAKKANQCSKPQAKPDEHGSELYQISDENIAVSY